MATIRVRGGSGGSRIVANPAGAGAGGVGGAIGVAGGSGPPCAICAGAGEGARRVVYLTHGVAVWLCPTHAADRYLAADEGRRFATDLAGMWVATGTLTARRHAALGAHLRRHRDAGAGRDRPGSYSWPVLRREAEGRFAAGEDPRTVIHELRARYADCPAAAPSARSMRRWYTHARWLEPQTPDPKAERNAVRRRIHPRYALLPYPIAQHLRWDQLRPTWKGG